MILFHLSLHPKTTLCETRVSTWIWYKVIWSGDKFNWWLIASNKHGQYWSDLWAGPGGARGVVNPKSGEMGETTRPLSVTTQHPRRPRGLVCSPPMFGYALLAATLDSQRSRNGLQFIPQSARMRDIPCCKIET